MPDTAKRACSAGCTKPKKSRWTKKSALTAMTGYLDELIRRSLVAEKRATVCLLNQLATSLRERGDLFVALEEVYPEKTAAARSQLALRLIQGCRRQTAS